MGMTFDKIKDPDFNRKAYKAWLAKHPQYKNTFDKSSSSKSFRYGHSTAENGAMLKSLADAEQYAEDLTRFQHVTKAYRDTFGHDACDGRD